MPDIPATDFGGAEFMFYVSSVADGGEDWYTRDIYAAEENDCIAVCYGHTHVPGCEDFSGITLLNPGSLSQPRDGTNGSYAIIRSTEDDFYTNIIYYDTVCGTKKKQEKKVKGGMLRNMLNYSDRF